MRLHLMVTMKTDILHLLKQMCRIGGHKMNAFTLITTLYVFFTLVLWFLYHSPVAFIVALPAAVLCSVLIAIAWRQQ